MIALPAPPVAAAGPWPWLAAMIILSIIVLLLVTMTGEANVQRKRTRYSVGDKQLGLQIAEEHPDWSDKAFAAASAGRAACRQLLRMVVISW
jgi:hypothetical protein